MGKEVSIKEAIFTRQQVLGELSTIERLNALSVAIQRRKDSPYAKDSYAPLPLFTVGDTVIVLSDLYYVGKIMAIWDHFMCPELKKNVPCYRVKYEGWTRYDQEDRQWVAEYDIFGLSKYKIPTELLMAHFFNQQKLLTLASPLTGLKSRGLYKMTRKEEELYIEEWNTKFSLRLPAGLPMVTFQQWIGLV